MEELATRKRGSKDIRVDWAPYVQVFNGKDSESEDE